MRVPEEPVCINLFRQTPVFTSLHLKSPVHVVPPLNPDTVPDPGPYYASMIQEISGKSSIFHDI
jgi:hypothetical protein